MKNLLTAAIVILAAFVMVIAGRALFTRAKATPEDAVQKLAANYNKTLPTMVDSQTRLDRVTARGLKIIYDFTLVNDPAPGQKTLDDPEVARQVEEGVAAKVCKSEETKPGRDLGVTFSYSYSSKDGRKLFDFEVTPLRCDFLRNPR